MMLGTGTARTFTYRPGGSGSTGLPLLASVAENGNAPRNISYDAAASQLADNVNSFAYGARELLGSALPNMQSYAYDGLRRRVQSQTAGGQQRISLYDGGNHLFAETALSAMTPTTISYDYVWFGDRPVAQLDAVGTHWTHTDHLGTPLIQTDASAAVSWQAEYEPYGRVWSLRAGDVHQPLRLPGQESEQYDAGANGSSDLSYNGARWYRPAWSGYTQADPLKLYAGTNLFQYANADPVSEFDPSGLASCAYSIAKHVLSCTSTSNNHDVRQMGPQYVWSGKQGTQCENNANCASKKNSGPIPPGTYSIDPDHWQRRGFYDLNPTGKTWVDKVPHLRGIINSIPFFGSRSGFELHLGTNSVGCITGDKRQQQAIRQFQRIEDLLNKEMGNNSLTVSP